MSTPINTESTTPRRLISLAGFFKNYLWVCAVLTAALPAPVAVWQLIPTFQAQTKFLAVYTSLSCYLLLGYTFYIRRELSSLMLPGHFQEVTSPPSPKNTRRVIIVVSPLLLVGLACFFSYLYHETLNDSIGQIVQASAASPTASSNSAVQEAPTIPPLTPLPAEQEPKKFSDVIKKSELNEIPCARRLMLYYLLIFLFTTMAFVLMAIKEYLQELAEISDLDLMGLQRTMYAEGEMRSPP